MSGAVSVIVHGLVNDATFQQCVEAAQFLNKEHAQEFSVSVSKVLPFEFEKKRKALRDLCCIPDETWPVVVEFAAAKKFMSAHEFIQTISARTAFRLFDVADDDPQSYRQLARLGYNAMLKEKKNTYVWMTISINNIVQGRIVYELFSNILPRTCQNFLHLCRGDLPDVTTPEGQKVKLNYKGSQFYRIVNGGWVQGGDITKPFTGNGGFSCYGRYFPDESFHVAHDAPGILGMVNDGEHTNSSSFYITMKKNGWMDQRYVAFGRVMEGLSVVQAIHDADVRHNQSPKSPITISECGQIEL